MTRTATVLLLAAATLSCAAVVSFDEYREPSAPPPPTPQPQVTVTVHCYPGSLVVFHDRDGVILDLKEGTRGVGPFLWTAMATTTTAASQVTVAGSYTRAYHSMNPPAGEPKSWTVGSFGTYVGVEAGDVLYQSPVLRTKRMTTSSIEPTRPTRSRPGASRFGFLR